MCMLYHLPSLSPSLLPSLSLSLSLSLSHTHTHTQLLPPRLPAYQKFHALAQPAAPLTTPLPSATPPVELPLPYSYQLLEEKFRCTDTVVSMLQKRKEICTFEKLKKAVQEMSRRWVLFGVCVHDVSTCVPRCRYI